MLDTELDTKHTSSSKTDMLSAGAVETVTLNVLQRNGFLQKWVPLVTCFPTG